MVTLVKGLCTLKGITIHRLKRAPRSAHLDFSVKTINTMNHATTVKTVSAYNHLIDYKKNVTKAMHSDLIKTFSTLAIDRNYIIWIKSKFFSLLKIISQKHKNER